VNVPMADLKAQYQSIRRDIDDAVHAVMENSRFILGDNVGKLEEEISQYCGAAYGVGVNSGTDALLLALSALGVGRGDEVITTPFTFVATVEVIALLGATPVFADIDPATYNLDPTRVEEKITSKTKVIMPVHLYGQTADVKRLTEIAKKHDLRLVCDGAQAIGAECDGKPIGVYGDITTLSFFPTKNLGGAGDGGMVLTNDTEIAEKVRCLRFHGSGGVYSYKLMGYCSRLDEIQAAILKVKLPHLDGWTTMRRNHADFYRSTLSDLDLALPVEVEGCKHVYHQFTVRCSDRDGLRAHLQANGVSTGIYYPYPLHLEEAYRYLGSKEGDQPEAERASHEVISLPIVPELSEEQMAHTVQSIRSFFGK